MAWFNRKEKGIVTPTSNKKETPDGLWYRCPECKNIMPSREHKQNAYTCIFCDHHERIGSTQYFEILFDNHTFTELDENLQANDPLDFVDSLPYKDKLHKSREKTNLKDAARTATGKMNDLPITVTCMDFSFIGGSMGSVVGEKIARGIDYARTHQTPFIMISRSGGARMQEGGFSLMQMGKTAARLALLAEAKLPYLSLMTHPTTGGVTASFAMLGDFNVAEPKTMIGFAGPRIIRETIGQDLPKGFQSSEYLLEHGFLDFIVHRRDLKKRFTTLLTMLR